MTRGVPEPTPAAGPASERVPEPVSETVRRLPAPALRPFVAWYTGYRQAGIAPARHRGLPSPVLTMIVTLDDALVIAAHPDPRQPSSEYDVLLGGLHTSPALITHDGRQSGIQLGLTPLGARALLGMPAGELVSIDVDAEDVLGRFAAELRERVRDADTWQARFAVLDHLLARRAEHDASMRPEVGYAWHRLLAADGAVPISKLAARTGWSARHLTGQFRTETGLPPKAAARVMRFTLARRLLRGQHETGEEEQGVAATLADIAAACGYYDQAHLARDFRDLAGCPPTVWLAEEFRNVQATPGHPGNDQEHE